MARFRAGALSVQAIPRAAYSGNVGFWLRLGAGLIDTAIGVGIVLLILTLAFVTGSADVTAGIVVAILGWIGAIAYGIVIFVLLSIRGQTLGKIAVGIKIVTDSGDVPGPSIALLRIVGEILTLYTLGLGFLFAAWDRDKKALHDHLAHTIVVRSR